MSPKSPGFGSLRASGRGKQGPCWAVTFQRGGHCGCTNRSCCSPYCTSLCIAENLGQERKKEKASSFGGLPRASPAARHSLFCWEHHSVLLFSLNSGVPPPFSVTDWFCCSKGCPVCQVTQAHCGPSPQSYVPSSSRKVLDLEIACPGHRKQQLESFVLCFVLAPAMCNCSMNNYCVAMD